MANRNKAEYDMKYTKENLKRIPLNVKKEKYEEIKALADKNDDSVNGYIKQAIDQYAPYSISFTLNKDITYDKNIFPSLEKILLENGDYLSGFTRKGGNEGKFFLILNFLDETPENVEKEIVEAYKNVLNAFNITYSYEKTTYREIKAIINLAP